MIPVQHNGKPLQTPAKHPLAVPTQQLCDAIAAEWQGQAKFSIAKMPLTSLAYTAIDRIGDQQEAIVEALMVYIDTDTLSYRSTGSDKLADRQKAQWDPVLGWAEKTFGAKWQVVSGLMPIEQPPALMKNVQNYLASLDAMRLAAGCVLASGYSSIVLALAVLKGHIDAEEAFRLSRLEEDTQAEQWGVDPEASVRTGRLKAEIVAAGQFLRLLAAA